jgi:hypothetical protein
MLESSLQTSGAALLWLIDQLCHGVRTCQVRFAASGYAQGPPQHAGAGNQETDVIQDDVTMTAIKELKGVGSQVPQALGARGKEESVAGNGGALLVQGRERPPGIGVSEVGGRGCVEVGEVEGWVYGTLATGCVAALRDLLQDSSLAACMQGAGVAEDVRARIAEVEGGG